MTQGFREGASVIALLAARHVDRMSLRNREPDQQEDGFYSDLQFLRQLTRSFQRDDTDFAEYMAEAEATQALPGETQDILMKRKAWLEFGAIIDCLVRKGAFQKRNLDELDTSGIFAVTP